MSLGVVRTLLLGFGGVVVHRHGPHLRAALALRVVIQPFLAQAIEDVEALARVQVEERAVVQKRVTANVVTRVGVIGLEVVGILGDLLDPSHQTPLPVVDGEFALVQLSLSAHGRVQQA